jgi:hypothetical protein
MQRMAQDPSIRLSQAKMNELENYKKQKMQQYNTLY